MPTATGVQSKRRVPYDARSYSFVRALRSAAADPDRIPSGLEGDVSALIEEGGRGGGRGFSVPLDVLTPGRARALDVATGAGAIQTSVVAPDLFTDVMRSKAAAGRLGAVFTSLFDGFGPAAIPEKTSGAAAEWIADGDDVTFSDPVIDDDADAGPQTVAAGVTVTRKMWNSTDAALHDYLVADLAAGFAAAVDRAVFMGGGTLEPVGLFNAAAGVPVQAFGTNGAAPTRALLLSMMRTVHAANGDAPAGAAMGWAAGVAVESKLRSVDGSTGAAGAWLWSDADAILGKPACSTTAIPETFEKGTGEDLGGLVYGDFGDVLVNHAPAAQVIVDPFTLRASGSIRVVAFLDVRIAIRHAASFVLAKDVVTTP